MTEYFSDSSRIPPKVKEFILQSSVPLSISDAHADDSPLVGFNKAFSDLTRYAPDEILGRNCRFLQPEEVKPPVCANIRQFLFEDDSENKRFLVPNIRKDGTKFVNLLYLSKIELDGVISFYLGSQFDYTRFGREGIDIYERSLKTDLANLNSLSNEMGWIVLGNMDALSSSHSLVAQAKFDQDFLAYE